MIVKSLASRSDRIRFYELPRKVYRGVPAHRVTDETLVHLLVDGPTMFHTHAAVEPYLLLQGSEVVGRFALIHDSRLPDVIQVSFFEALPSLPEMVDSLADAARRLGTGARRLVVGLNGHLNYGAGFLLNHFEMPPAFGLPYSPSYYAEYFKGLHCLESVSFRYELPRVHDWMRSSAPSIAPGYLRLRTLDKRHLRRDIELYTHIDNATFSNAATPYWSDRMPEENYELFHPFRFLIRPEHLVFAEKNGEPVGFVLWYPDFNQLVSSRRNLNIADVIRFRLANPLTTIRLAEVAILPRFQSTPALAALMLGSLAHPVQAGYEFCEAGFIFTGNTASMNLARRYSMRAHRRASEGYRRYGIFEMTL